MPASMIVLSDRPEAMAGLIETPGAEWRRASTLDAPTWALWDALGSGMPAWWLDTTPVIGAGRPWSRLVLIEHAPHSQFDQLRGPLAGLVRDIGPVVCLALDGRGFHGQRGRPWRAAAGNLHLSAAVPVRWPVATHAAALSMLPAVAVVDAVTAATGGAVRPAIKWVNDIVVPAGKLAGVLTSTQVLGGDIDLVVMGIGLNVASEPLVDPTPFVPSVACLSHCPGGERVGLAAALWAMLDALARRLALLEARGPSPIWRDYVAASAVLGRRVRVWDESASENADVRMWPRPLAAGVVTDIGPDLTLALEGGRDRIERGRLALEEACQRFEL